MPCRRLLYAVLYLVAPAIFYGETKTALTPQACTEVRYLSSNEVTYRSALQLSRDSKQVAYVLQSPNLGSDEYEDELYVAALDGTSHSKPTSIIRSGLITAVTWFPDNRHLALLTRVRGKIVLARVDTMTRHLDIIKEAQNDITDYSMDSSGNSIAVAVKIADRPTGVSPALMQRREGYRLDLNSVEMPGRSRRQVYILHGTGLSHWTAGASLSFVSPYSRKRLDDFSDAAWTHVNISPNGRYLLLDNLEPIADAKPKQGWENSPLVNSLKGDGGVTVLNYVYDLHSRVASMPLKSPIVRDQIWAPDSKSYAAVAVAPVGSQWEKNDLAEGAPSLHSTHLFSVDIQTERIREVSERTEKPPLAWMQNGDLEVQDKTGAIHIVSMNGDNWKETGSFQIPLSNRALYLPVVSDGHRFVMEYESPSTPPEILQFDLSNGQINNIAKLNPQVDGLLLPRIEHIAWATSTGYKAKGLLILPPDYDPRRRYPIVIENGSILYEGQFVCDSGSDHVSSFVRGILADSGVIYLTREWPSNEDWKSNYYPKGYPGQIGEAAFQLDLVESAVRYLDSRNMIDTAKIGLIGFSRGGWYTEYALTQSHIKFAAATATDNITYSLGQYWYLFNDYTKSLLEGMYGGPPYGATFDNWLKYSISFNLDKIRTPLLIEVMGFGHQDDDPTRPFNNRAAHYEEFVGLSRLSKPVELYYYPLEQHQVDHPVARIAALQRNVDWYRFWLQGYERPNPTDPDQYKRWEHLRVLRDAESSADQTKQATAESLRGQDN
jgi:dipeptidyl aminopeptidase/acylaminoacyl peptidase